MAKCPPEGGIGEGGTISTQPSKGIKSPPGGFTLFDGAQASHNTNHVIIDTNTSKHNNTNNTSNTDKTTSRNTTNTTTNNHINNNTSNINHNMTLYDMN